MAHNIRSNCHHSCFLMRWLIFFIFVLQWFITISQRVWQLTNQNTHSFAIKSIMNNVFIHLAAWTFQICSSTCPPLPSSCRPTRPSLIIPSPCCHSWCYTNNVFTHNIFIHLAAWTFQIRSSTCPPLPSSCRPTRPSLIIPSPCCHSWCYQFLRGDYVAVLAVLN